MQQPHISPFPRIRDYQGASPDLARYYGHADLLDGLSELDLMQFIPESVKVVLLRYHAYLAKKASSRRSAQPLYAESTDHPDALTLSHVLHALDEKISTLQRINPNSDLLPGLQAAKGILFSLDEEPQA